MRISFSFPGFNPWRPLLNQNQTTLLKATRGSFHFKIHKICFWSLVVEWCSAGREGMCQNNRCCVYKIVRINACTKKNEPKNTHNRQVHLCWASPQFLCTACWFSRKKYLEASEMKSQSAVRFERSFCKLIQRMKLKMLELDKTLRKLQRLPVYF